MTLPHKFAAVSLSYLGLFTLSVAACTGSVGEVGSQDGEGGSQDATRPSGGAGTGIPGPNGATSEKEPFGQGDSIAAGARPLRRLSRSEYNRTVRDLLGETSRPADAFPKDVRGPSGYFTPGDVTDTEFRRLQDAAETVAQKAIANVATLAPCSSPGLTAEAVCATKFLDTFGMRMFRRPLTSAERGDLTALYKAVRDTPFSYAYADGIRVMLTAMLQAPAFLYHWGAPQAPVRKEGMLVQLEPYELASRLSFFLWGSVPDAELFAAAAAGKLSDVAELDRQARRMLSDAKAGDVVEEFHRQWLGIDELAAVVKDPKVFPTDAFGDELKLALTAETSAFARYAVLEKGGLTDLLTAPVVFVNQPLAKLYGIAGVTGQDLRRMPAPPERFGILTNGSFLATQSTTYSTSPVKRGEFVLKHLLCESVPPPPPTVDITPPSNDPTKQTREQYQMHTKDPSCAACHQRLDPPGFAFEGYDGIGRRQTTEAGRPINSTGKLTVGDDSVTFDDAKQLVAQLATTATVRSCIARQWFRYAWSRNEADSDLPSLAAAYEKFASSKFDIRELMLKLVTTRSFRYRQPAANEVL